MAELPVLPDLRNLGTILRILLAVNAAALVAAFAREQHWNALPNEWIALTSYVEPYLLLELAMLWLIAPWLLRQTYAIGVTVVAVVTIIAGIAVNMLIERLLPGQAGSLPRQLAFALAMALVLISYFRLRVKALSPAITEARLQALQARIRPHDVPRCGRANLWLGLEQAQPPASRQFAAVRRHLVRPIRGTHVGAHAALQCVD